ncbi:NOL1/NOP2/sun family putative RNA methylase [Weissella uvarum]|uniref:RsmF rRNA methyltransferase first C-terminal domain-containing protein n=1 Tax=Weissella uvarum TaxID=1479233 RepID=UPI001961DB4B|nr:RsmF rRNA methyltransferase first C-terminal domain-containing protein [Weissella uvarum]MBM7617151.1 NOL1/NOP2/sun family putative RNA methylase [Weissella uvarum]MCM0595447.1 RsmF rRNA methyltransferase first C-terminal domain-containing protein [Weissella uvarum]
MDLPVAFEEKYRELLGEEADAFFTALAAEPAKAFRINPLKANTSLTDTKAEAPIPWSRYGYYGDVYGHSVDHTDGLVYSQEPSAQLVGELAAPKPGQKVLDLAAAPGGKSTHLASFMQQSGLLVSNEINKKRAGILSENMERFGVANSLVTNHDATSLAKKFPEYFDVIVLDAPCSGEGMFRKDPDAMQYWSADYPAENAARQKEILTDTVKMLKPGGTLVYSTCTFAPEEDEQVVAWLLDNYPEFSIDSVEKAAGVDDGRPEWADGNPELKKTVRLFPQHVAGEGHFMAKLHKAGSPDTATAKVPKLARTNLTAEQRDLWAQFAQENLVEPLDQTLYAFGDQLYALPTDTPDLKGLQVLRAGLHLGTFKKKRFEPSLALALALHPGAFQQTYAMSIDEWKQYVHGDTFMIENGSTKPNGWYVLTMAGNGVGFGKLVNGQMKNFYPKGLRFIAREPQTVEGV